MPARLRSSTLPLAVALVLLGLAAAGCRSADRGDDSARLAAALPVAEGVNVLVLSFDALRADALGVYGAERPTSPQVDAFAREALVLEQAYSTAPVTPTSFASAFSGCLPHRVFRDWQFRAPVTLAEIFATAGYRTAAFIHNAQLNATRGFDRGFQHYDHVTDGTDEALLERATAWLAAHREERHFVWIHLLTPHAPYRRRDDASGFYAPAYDGPFKDVAPPRFVATTPADLGQVRALYDGEVLHADQLFGRLTDALRAHGLLDRTLLALTSDHGEEFGEHGGFRHGRLYGEHLRIPLVLRHPRAARGSRSAVLVSNADLAPTLAAVAGLTWPHPCDGRNLRALAPGAAPVASLVLTDPAERAATLRRDRHRLIVTCAPAPGVELYDLAADPGERRDVAAEQPELRGALEAELWATLGVADCAGLAAGAVSAQAETRDLDPRTVEALRALGYLDDP